ncbi:hypothetical protein SAY87_016573 [Trapa incisa]|uniref:Uncharacterized protein n=1 Tax=Trapa incisa TaxID=236973 RepID=A0AAN7QVH4_9MYRT|nr:hypothetical protein SAY87_016573 [Trapa incisa]
MKWLGFFPQGREGRTLLVQVKRSGVSQQAPQDQASHSPTVTLPMPWPSNSGPSGWWIASALNNKYSPFGRVLTQLSPKDIDYGPVGLGALARVGSKNEIRLEHSFLGKQINL